MNKYIDGWKCEEAVMFVLGIIEASINDYQNQLEGLSVTEYDSNGDEINDRAREIEFDTILHKSAQGLELLEALQHEVTIAIEQHDHTVRCNYAQMGHILPEDVIFEQPTESTPIELYRYDEKQNINEIKIKKRSFATWLHQLGELELSEKVDPNLNIEVEKETSSSDIFSGIDESILAKFFDKSSSSNTTLKSLFEADEIPDLLYFAYDTFLQVWLNLPKDMKQPTKEQLTRYLREVKGVKLQSEVDAIIKVSTPSGITLGGRQKPNLTSWRPLSERK